MRRIVVIVLVLSVTLLVGSPFARAAGDWTWPVVGPVLRLFDLPDSPYGSGHRGIDIAGAPGTVIVAPEAGQVTFAGPVGGELYVTIDHGGGVRSTLSWLTALLVRRDDVVTEGQPIAVSGTGHADGTVPHVHLGVRVDDVYVDPLDLLGPLSVSGFIRLAPWPTGS